MNLNTLHIFIQEFVRLLRNRKTLMHLHPVQFPDLILCFGQLLHQRLMLLPECFHLIDGSIIAFIFSLLVTYGSGIVKPKETIAYDQL